MFTESFENYSKRTCQVLAVQELGSSSSDPINPQAVITPKRIVRDAAKTNMTRNIIDDRRKFPCTVDGCNMYGFKINNFENRIHIYWTFSFSYQGPSSKNLADKHTLKEYTQL
jgi:hypothetical protein